MKLGTIVVGTDFSAEADRAVAHAVALARRTGGRLLICHVETATETMDIGLTPGGAPLDAYRQVMADGLVENRRLLDELARRHAASGVAVETAITEGFADSALIDLANERGADLIVVATHGRHGLSRVLLGSVAEKVVRLFERAVMVTRGDPPPDGGYRRVLVPTDFTPRAERALRAALELAGDGGEVIVFHAWSLTFGHYVPGPASDAVLAPIRASVEGAAREKGDALVAAHRSDRVALRFEVAEGAAARAIEARAADCDLVVIGSHGRRGVRRWLLGSLSEATVRGAPCTVVVVHDAAADAG